MGSQILITCSKCNLSRTQTTGVGFMGRGSELCACYRCGKFVEREIREANFMDDLLADLIDEEPDDVEDLDDDESNIETVGQSVTTCGTCGDTLQLIRPQSVGRVWDDEETYMGSQRCECPICGGDLFAESTGLMWD